VVADLVNRGVHADRDRIDVLAGRAKIVLARAPTHPQIQIKAEAARGA
jgi:hypothetical protein